ncbi:hypothetical protein DFH29DRAFT_960220 [Suillus ampliporus]|nr:hypothetical protein DFH29DRAFT_960220 [Suillus ampliporus]
MVCAATIVVSLFLGDDRFTRAKRSCMTLTYSQCSFLLSSCNLISPISYILDELKQKPRLHPASTSLLSVFICIFFRFRADGWSSQVKVYCRYFSIFT